MSSLNRCEFIGNLGADPDVRYLPNGDATASISIGCTDKWKDKTTGDIKEATEWVRCVAWRKLAEIIGEYAKKGSKVYVSGKMKTRSYEKDGQTRYVTEIVLDQLILLGGGQRGEGEGSSERRSSSSSSSSSQRQPQERSGAKSGSAGRAPAGGGFDEMDDDIPFQNPYKGVMQGLAALGF